MKNKIKRDVEENLKLERYQFHPTLNPKSSELVQNNIEVHERLFENVKHSKICNKVCHRNHKSETHYTEPYDFKNDLRNSQKATVISDIENTSSHSKILFNAHQHYKPSDVTFATESNIVTDPK